MRTLADLAKKYSYTTGGAEPYNTGSASTTGGGVGTTMKPGGVGTTAYPTTSGNPLQPYFGQLGYTPPVPAGTGGFKPTPGSVGSASLGWVAPPAGAMLPGMPGWETSPAGKAAQWQAAVGSSPFKGLMPNQGRMPGGPAAGPAPRGTDNGLNAYINPATGTRYTAADNGANFPRTWYAKELAAAGIPWQGLSDAQQMQAYLNTLSPEERQSYLAQSPFAPK